MGRLHEGVQERIQFDETCLCLDRGQEVTNQMASSCIPAMWLLTAGFHPHEQWNHVHGRGIVGKDVF